MSRKRKNEMLPDEGDIEEVFEAVVEPSTHTVNMPLSERFITGNGRLLIVKGLQSVKSVILHYQDITDKVQVTEPGVLQHAQGSGWIKAQRELPIWARVVITGVFNDD